MDQLIRLLNYISNYINLTEEEEALFLSKIRLKRYLRGQYVAQEGEICKYESFVLSGSLRSFYLDKEGKEHIVMFAIENWWTGDLGSFLTQTPAKYNVQCLENSLLAQLSFDTLEELYIEIPKLERFFRIIVQKAFVAAQNRVIENISMTAKERYLQFRNRYPEIDQRVPQYMVASYLGMSAEFLSKIRNRIADKS